MNRILIGAIVGVLGLSVAGLWLFSDPSLETETGKLSPCHDGDPCTIDRYHDAKKRCIHVPDPLCTKPCKLDSDCAYSEDKAPCMSASCHEGSCRYMNIGIKECIRCDSETPCKGTYCDPRQCQDGFCRHAPITCDDGDPNTRDMCDDAISACRHDLADGLRSCSSNEDCKTLNGCNSLECKSGVCRVTQGSSGCTALTTPRRCKGNSDCIDSSGKVCLAGPCVDGWCQMREVPNSKDCKPCTGDHDCDGSFCEWPICTGTVCTVETVPFCQDVNPDTEDICSEELQACLHPYKGTPPKCSKAPKDDGDPQTVDVCDTDTGQTEHLSAGDGRCKTDNRCWYTYLGSDGFCLGHKIICRHDDACEAFCDPVKGCVLDASKDCHCRSDAECDLNSPCARVFCMNPGPDGACWGTFINDCVPCESDNDCQMDNWCVFGTCADDGYCRYTDGVTCDDKNPETFGFCHGQRDDPCTYEPIYEWLK